MDGRKRAALRAVFTKEAKDLRDLMGEEQTEAELKARLNFLESRFKKLTDADSEILQALLVSEEQPDLEKEFLTTGEYELTYYQLKEAVQIKLDSLRPPTTVEHAFQGWNKQLKLKRPEIRKFGGEVKHWISFWAQFSKIHEDESLNAEDKFAFLSDALIPGSPAQKLIEGFPPSRENYAKALEILKSRYGKDEFLIEYYVRELLSLVLKKSEHSCVAQLYDQLEAQLRALDSLGVTKEKYAAMIFPLVESAVPEPMYRIWERHRIGKKASIKDAEECLNELLSFLKIETEGEERLRLRKSTFQTKADCEGGDERKTKPKLPSASALLTTGGRTSPGNNNPSCIFCDRNHSSADCTRAIDMCFNERMENVKKRGACYRCLRRGHFRAKCKALVKCAVCKGKHVPLMCAKIQDTLEKAPQAEKHEDSTKTMVASNTINSTVYLQTLVAKVVSNGQEYSVRILIDSGSQKSYVLKSCVREFKLKRQGKTLVRKELFGGQKTALKTHGLYKVTLKSMTTPFSFDFEALDQEQICGFVPRINNVGLYDTLRDQGIILTDFSMNPMEPMDIRILLGADAWPHIITGNFKKLDSDLVAVETKLGWSVIGTYKEESSVSSTMLATLVCQAHLSNFWELELLGIKDPGVRKTQAEKDREVEEFFENTVSKDLDGRYMVKFPWIEGHPMLRNNRDVAVKRLMSTTKNLKQIGKYEDYDRVIKDWLEQGIIEHVPLGDTDRNCHFLPHRAVLKENSTTKIRPVFDASSRDEDGHSLNECLEKGPNQIEQIPLVITHFRQFPIGVSADIEKAFLQISLDPGDRDWLRFLWWDEGKMIMLRHCRVVFGVSSSPYLLGAVLKHHLKNAPLHLQETAEKLLHSFHVDNCLTGVENEEELGRFVEEGQELLGSAKFNLRGWVSNMDHPGKQENMLGLKWNHSSDLLS